jgi:hypothetical protein
MARLRIVAILAPNTFSKSAFITPGTPQPPLPMA